MVCFGILVKSQLCFIFDFSQMFSRCCGASISALFMPFLCLHYFFILSHYEDSLCRWSLGAIMFEMLVGYPPFYSDDPMNTCRKVRCPTFCSFGSALSDLITCKWKVASCVILFWWSGGWNDTDSELEKLSEVSRWGKVITRGKGYDLQAPLWCRQSPWR